MAYNPIAPTSSRENRKPPTHVPQSAVLIVEEDGSIWATTEQVEGVPFTVDGTMSNPRLAIVGESVVAIPAGG